MPNDEEQIVSKNEQERAARLKEVKKRKIKKSLTWILVLAVIAAVIYGLVFWSRQEQENKPGGAVPELGRDHINVGAEHEPYNSNPPTSGQHYASPANWGIYDAPLPDEQLIHNLEHGGIWISYRDAGNTGLVDQLKSIADDYSLKVILTPRSQNDSPVAVAAWGRLLKLDNFDEDQIRGFIGAFINRGPEQVPF